MQLSDSAQAALVTGLIGVISVVIAWILSRGKVRNDFGTTWRNELREDVKFWKEVAVEKGKEADTWRSKYSELEEKYDIVRNEYERLKMGLKP